MKRGIFSTLLFSGMVLAGVPSAGWCTEPGFTFRDLLVPRLKTSDTNENWIVRRVTPAGRKQFLALLGHSKYRLPKWLDTEKIRKEKRERGVVRSVTLKRVYDNWVLAIINDRGKILHLSNEPQASELEGNVISAAYSVPLVMDRTPTCPYAILNTGGGTLLCYDYQLAFMGKKEIPLDDVRYPKVTFDGEDYTLWVFGKRSSSRTKIKGFDDWVKRPPEAAQSYGVRLHLQDGAWSPIPIDPEGLFRDLERIARGPDGEKLKLHPASISISPFRDLDTDEGFWVLIQAVASEKFESQVLFSGTRVFFRSRLDSQGLGKIEQLPLWLTQEDRQDVVLDEDTGVVRFPRWTLQRRLQGFSLGKNDFLLALMATTKTPEADGSYGEISDGVHVTALFSGTQEVHFIPEEKLEKPEGLSHLDDMRVLPMTIKDRVGKSEFAFGTLCTDKRGRQVSCLALMSLTD